jgi:blocked-early-in-transport protein 1
MDGAGNLMGGTIKKLTDMMNAGGSKHMCYLVGFIVFVFMLIWYMLK